MALPGDGPQVTAFTRLYALPAQPDTRLRSDSVNPGESGSAGAEPAQHHGVNTMKRLTRTLVLAAALAAAPLALANPKHDHHGPGPEASMARHLAGAVKHLDLSDAQAESIKALFEANKEDLKANAIASRELRETLHALLTADTLDEEALAEAARQEGQLAEERVLLTGTLASQVLAELDDEQRAELHAMRSERMERHRERFSARSRKD